MKFKIENIFLFFFILFFFLIQFNFQNLYVDLISQLSFQILIVGLFFFIISFFFKKIWVSIITILLCIILSFQILLPCSHCKSILDNKENTNTKIKLMTFNVYHMNSFNNFNNFTDEILRENPDIIQFQEVSKQVKEKIKSLESFYPHNVGLNESFTINPNIKSAYVNYYINSIMNKKDSNMLFGNIILSKFPLTNSKIVDHRIIITEVKVNNYKFTLLGVHLYPPASNHYYDLALKQIIFLKNYLINSNKNIILIGDLNMTSISKRFKNFLKETDLFTYVSYLNLTNTWPSFLSIYLGIQIDHVLFSDNFKLINKKYLDNYDSDHRPLIVEILYN